MRVAILAPAEPEPDARQPDPTATRDGETVAGEVLPRGSPRGTRRSGRRSGCRRELRERVPDVRWARPETLHLTVHFFGRIDEVRAATALELRGADCPQHVHHSTSPWIGSARSRREGHPVSSGSARRAMSPSSPRSRSNVASRSAPPGFDVEERPYHAHCTLGRPAHAVERRGARGVGGGCGRRSDGDPFHRVATGALRVAVRAGRRCVHRTSSLCCSR